MKPTPKELPGWYCLVCGKRLEPQRCKMICRRCGYFMSCSEFDYEDCDAEDELAELDYHRELRIEEENQ